MEISVQNFSPDVAMHLMLATLRLRPFTDNLCMQPTTSLDELRKRATKFMQLEELREFRKHALAEASGEKNKDEKECQGRLGHRGDRRRDNRGSRFSRYTPLMVERGRILDKALNVEPIPHPRKAANPSNMERRKQCRYHQNSGHSTEECQAFKDKIDELIQARHRAGSLGVAETRGIPLAGTSPLKDDHMVISVNIDRVTIRKTLVDQGSAVDILYWKTFNAMRIPEVEMVSYDDHVVGFSGERVGTKGYFELYATFGEEKSCKTIKIQNLVIIANTSYNILLGRSSINQLMAIVSTPNLAMKFPSPSEDILTIHIDQKEVRECYA
ncbi:uncharacterized protein [Phaseolus vulgaris]|uniref:uncharacterized protein n=1 Tax=Phaseolus vulgaris TaxID=3885 RepID=UPI0035CC9067